MSALHTLHHATLTIIRLFAPFVPFVTGTLHDIFERAVDDTVHARGKWPRLADHTDPQLDRNLGDAFVEIVSAGRKVKSDLAVSLRSPVTTLTISPGNGDMEVEQIRGLLGGNFGRSQVDAECKCSNLVRDPVYCSGIVGCYCKQHFLYFRPLPHGHGSLRPTLLCRGTA
jgi:isoleucyl-tRNA synthetase